MSAFSCRACASAAASISGVAASSASTKEMYSPRAASSPRFRARPCPPFSVCSTRIRASSFASASHNSPEPSVLPSSTRISSKSFMVCPRTEATHAGRNGRTLYTGTITETSVMPLLPAASDPPIQSPPRSCASAAPATRRSVRCSPHSSGRRCCTGPVLPS